jgi:transcriptional regulator with XRE-family HTH domain
VPSLNVYKTYSFKTKDPAIDKLRTKIQDAGESYNDISVKSGVSVGTLNNWFNGGTRRPQFATLAAVAGALGYDWSLVKKR